MGVRNCAHGLLRAPRPASIGSRSGPPPRGAGSGNPRACPRAPPPCAVVPGTREQHGRNCQCRVVGCRWRSSSSNAARNAALGSRSPAGHWLASCGSRQDTASGGTNIAAQVRRAIGVGGQSIRNHSHTRSRKDAFSARWASEEVRSKEDACVPVRAVFAIAIAIGLLAS